MSDPDPLDEPLLSADQTLWVVISVGWVVIGAVALAVGRDLFGIGWILLGLASTYRIFRPG